eukprot:TRINITY_DN34331_c0_g1_i1.p1 TRINITY_DN34331_c0_g1~~TRINITY_DN34331_c0_g1_i1.p1  ORF type:complete len:432 (+),score=61.89 TRINITY_DN34331_c0_g1_i1:38-1333(+)
MTTALEIAEAAWRGGASKAQNFVHFAAARAPLHWFDPTRTGRCGFWMGFANVGVIDTKDGLVLIDSASFLSGGTLFDEIRKEVPAQKPVHTCVFTHGHVDHVMGIVHFDRESEQLKRPRPRVVAHRNVAARFQRYRLTLGYNSHINSKQFRVKVPWPEEYREVDLAYDGSTVLQIGGKELQLFHAKGETDDATWVFVPEDRVLYTGDLFIWAVPNCGNPQKAQRYPREWAEALRAMQRLRPVVLCPGHGPLIVGEERVSRALGDVASYLERLCEAALAGMNSGLTLNQVIHQVKPPLDLADRPYLQPVYDDPEFIVRNLWRLYAGWFDQNPAHLKPAEDSKLAKEVTRLTGGVDPLINRALELLGRRESAHLIEWAYSAEPDNTKVLDARRRVYESLENAEPSLMASSIYRSARLESEERLAAGRNHESKL